MTNIFARQHWCEEQSEGLQGSEQQTLSNYSPALTPAAWGEKKNQISY